MPVGKMNHIEVKATSQSCLHEAYTLHQKARQKQEAAGEALWFWFQKNLPQADICNFFKQVTYTNKTS